MFGVVPKPLWSRVTAADDANRIQLDTNCIVVRTPKDIVLIDSGYGTKCKPDELEHMAAEQPIDLVGGLAKLGISRDDVNWVIPSHLHFDHAGGLTTNNESGKCVPTFPRARHLVQKAELEDGLGDKPELVGNYPTDELQVLADAGRFETVDGSCEPVDTIRVCGTGGHTRGHQTITIHCQGKEAIYLGDLCPTSAHLKTFWTMAYDQFPLSVRQAKPRLFATAVERQQLVIFDHDPTLTAAYLKFDARGRIVIAESFAADAF